MSREDLRKIIRRIDGKGFGFFRELKGSYDLGAFRLTVDHVQADPFAPPSRMRLSIPWDEAGWEAGYLSSRPRKKAFEDRVAREFRRAVRRRAPQGRFDGRGGSIEVECNGQALLERNTVVATEESLEARFAVGLPARGRRILGREAEDILLERLPWAADRSLRASAIPPEAMNAWVTSAEDQDFLRRWIVGHGYVAFVADGSVLPRRSGVDDRPLEADPGQPFIRFRSPDSFALTVELPRGGSVRGMAIPPGVTLIVGGGFHGKSTLLGAISRGVYDHIPGDGRERVVADPTATKIRAEDGRSIVGVDLSPIIGTLPYGRTTESFSTVNASGSTSQAAGIMEALEAGARVLLMDEDTCATNMMIRDARMRALVPDDREPIIPFVEKVRGLFREHGVSTILVMGGAGDYLGVADTVIMMDSYRARDVTDRARAIGGPQDDDGGSRTTTFGCVPSRRPAAGSFAASRGRKEVAIDAKGVGFLRYGEQTVDGSLLEQLIDIGQTWAVGRWIHRFASRGAGDAGPMREGLERIAGELEKEGLDLLDPRREGVLAMPRVQEVAAMINRMRGLTLRVPARGPEDGM